MKGPAATQTRVLGFLPVAGVTTLLLIVTTLCAFVPFLPSMPASGLDPSWRLALNEAVARSLIFGSDIVFTYGPYAQIMTAEYHPATSTAMYLGTAYLALVFTFCLLSIMRGGTLEVVVACLIVMLAAVSRDALFLICPPLILIKVVQTSRRLDRGTISARSFASLVFVMPALGLLLFTKGSLIPVSIISAGLCFAFALYAGHRWIATASVIAPIASACILWISIGQPIDRMIDCLRGTLSLVPGYSDAMSTSGPLRVVVGYLVTSAAVLYSILNHRGTPLAVRAVLLAMFSAFLLTGLKGAYVRQDQPHAILGANALLLCGFVLQRSLRSRTSLVALASVALFWLFSAGGNLHDSATLFAAPSKNAWRGLAKTWDDPNWKHTAFKREITRIRSAFSFPHLVGSTDIYSYDQTNLLVTSNHWAPRPVFQSYAAYDEALIARNASHLIGEGAPDNVLFSVQTIDGRLPSMDDGASWPLLISHYKATDIDGDFLLFRRRAKPAAETVITRTNARAHLGESVVVPRSSRLTYASFEINPTLKGRAMAALLRNDALQIILTLNDGRTISHRIVPRMARSEFLLSPLVENTGDLAGLLGVYDDVRVANVTSFIIDMPHSNDGGWANEYSVKFSERLMPAPEAIATQPRHRAVRFESISAQRHINQVSCDGRFESLKFVPSAHIDATPPVSMSVSGWLVGKANSDAVAAHLVAIVRDAHGAVLTAPLHRMIREDLAFTTPQLAEAAFFGHLDLVGLARPFTLSLAFDSENELLQCRGSETSVNFEATPSAQLSH